MSAIPELAMSAQPDERRNLAGTGDRRTWLVTPGCSPGRFTTATGSGADIALLDLEDSVPAVAKAAARAEVLAFLRKGNETGSGGAAALGVRVNPLHTSDGLQDLLDLAGCEVGPAVLLVPKVEAARDLELVAGIVDMPNRPCRVWALIETPQALANLSNILRAPHLAGVVFGAADYAAAAGCHLGGRALWYPRAALAAGAAAAGLPAVDSPYFGLHDVDGLRQETEQAVELGFVGKVAIHPRQLSVIQAVLRPDPADVEAARAVVRAADAAGGGITTVDDRMVGPPLVAAARAMTLRADEEPATSHMQGEPL